jgi:Na+-driven multidrug efflux pump
MDILGQYTVAIIVAFCLAVGYILKKWVKDVDNKLIPTAVALIGVFLNIWMNGWTVTPEIILAGIASGLASTGAFELGRNLIGMSKKEDDE